MGAMPYMLLIPAAVLEVWGDYLIRVGLPAGWAGLGRMILGAVMLAAYGFVVNVLWRGRFGELLGLYVAIFLVVSQVWAWSAGEPIPATQKLGAILVVLGGLLIQLSPAAASN